MTTSATGRVPASADVPTRTTTTAAGTARNAGPDRVTGARVEPGRRHAPAPAHATRRAPAACHRGRALPAHRLGLVGRVGLVVTATMVIVAAGAATADAAAAAHATTAATYENIGAVSAGPGAAVGSGQVLVLALAESVDQVLTNVRNWLMGILAALATVFATLGGVRYAAANGDPAEIERAKAAFRSAGWGYVLATLAPLLINILRGLVGA